MEQSICLEFKNERSHKVYNVDLINQESGFVVNFSYGRYGSTLRTGTKTQSSVGYDKALAIFNKLVKSKTSKGYQSVEGVNTHSHVECKSTGISCQLLNTISESQAMSFITSQSAGWGERCESIASWWMQEKHDGERKLIKVVNGEALVINKLGNTSTIAQSILDEILALGKDILLDGEAVGEIYHVFDILEFRGQCMRSKPYNERMFSLMSIGFNGNVRVVETARTPREKLEMYNLLKSNNAEGVVLKNSSAYFEAGRPNSKGNHLKFKFYDTASVIVSHINDKRSVGMSILDTKGNSISIGNVTIPVNKVIPSKGDVIEVRYLYAYKGGSLYQPIFLNKRNDVLPPECLVSQLKYKRDLCA